MEVGIVATGRERVREGQNRKDQKQLRLEKVVAAAQLHQEPKERIAKKAVSIATNEDLWCAGDSLTDDRPGRRLY
jgi:TRAP-type uncharacterized transport system substrate-binding protein